MVSSVALTDPSTGRCRCCQVQSDVSRCVHVNNFALEALWQVYVGEWPALFLVLPISWCLLRVLKNQLCHILQKENIHYLERTQ